jgi:hypothetical protein
MCCLGEYCLAKLDLNDSTPQSQSTAMDIRVNSESLWKPRTLRFSSEQCQQSWIINISVIVVGLFRIAF